MSEKSEQISSTYECMKCGAIVKYSELELGIRCPYCRYRVLKKTRPPIVRHLKSK